jgi:hypothetical protein
MKHGLFFLIWAAMLAFLFAVVGTLALLGYCDATVSFWSRNPIQSDTGKLVWIVISGLCFLILSTLIVLEYRRRR